MLADSPSAFSMLATVEWDAKSQHILHWDSVAEQWFGYAAAQALGRSLFQILCTPSERARVIAELEQVLQSGQAVAQTIRNRTKDGRELVCEWRHLPKSDGQMTRVVSTVAQATVETGKAIQNHSTSTAMQVKSRWLANISHEFRTPLNAIIGFTDLLTGDVSLSAEQLDYVTEIRNAGEHLLSLVNDVLLLSQIENGTLNLESGPVSMHEVLGSALTMIRPIAFDHQITLGMMPDVRGVYVQGDKRRITQVLLNLLSNAIKYNRADGRADVFCELEDSQLLICVSDTGIGIADADMEKLFVPYQRVGKHHYKVDGTGLGLSISRWLVEQMGGKLFVESCEGIGSCFYLQLPIANRVDRIIGERRIA
ncbi:MAG: PAS domain-containing sensor histidine kinase [Gammaproteobacteria bacterium]|nr:PAS domain-containing sensor histidine kinase [Gammaproteobacteria bacterium]